MISRLNMVAVITVSVLMLSLSAYSKQYGVDVSFPIHSPLPHSAWQAERYDKMMVGCYRKYTEQECTAVEEQRIEMNLEQPRSQHNYTLLGFGLARAPEAAWKPLKEFYNKNKIRQHAERWPRGNTYTNHWESPTNFISVEESADGGSAHLKDTIWNGLKPVIEEWIGQKIYPTSQYGVRLYSSGSMLSTHVDRLPLVASCIINVDQDLDEPWPIEVYSHDGQAYNITMAPGDMVLYESSTILHGRVTPLKGRSYANIFVHFKPYNHDAFNMIDQKESAHKTLNPKYSGFDYHNLDSQSARRRSLRKQSAAVKQPHTPGGSDAAELFNNEYDFGYTTPLQIAVYDQDIPKIRALYEEYYKSAESSPPGYDINEPNSYGWTPLHMAVRTGNLDVVRLLVEEYGADVNALSKYGGTPLFWSKRVLSPIHKVTKYLLNIDALDEQVP